MIEIDGNFCEGGGQIVRTALALSTITGKSFRITDIRKGRKDSGLKQQHLFCVNVLKEVCNAEVTGNELGSDFLEFKPKKFKAKNIDVDIETAGSVTLFLQSLMIPYLFANKSSTIKVKGGTDTKWSMPVDYFSNVFVPQIRKYADITFSLIKRGYYPKGNGEIEIKIKPKYNFNKESKENIPKLNLVEQGTIAYIKGISHASKDLMKSEVAERQARSAEMELKKNFENINIEIRTEYCDTLSTGSGITLMAYFYKNDEIDPVNPVIIAGDSLGERGKKAETVGNVAVKNLLKQLESKAPIDQYLEDNIIPYLGLFGGKFRFNRLTNHTKTNIYVIEKFLDRTFKIENNIISVEQSELNN
jgi:RNA 3'-terminal phosphate cyclase (GTP)